MAITELETLKDINFYKELGKFTSNNKIKELLRSKVIKFIKRDIEESTFIPNKYIESNGRKDEPWTDYGATKLPNGKYCKCDPETSCSFHNNFNFREFHNITEGEL